MHCFRLSDGGLLFSP